ncbi:hypothetical protein LX36DRAFT_589824 [Colletotrichum falcatum]|nr:hypothetical protein LX36DRAFT_589824 [Colletotrichum falcatum]
MDQKEFRSFASNSKAFFAEEIAVLDIQTVAEFEQSWNLVIDSKRKLEASRQRGIGKLMDKVHQGMSSAHDILQHIDPIIQIVQTVGAPYGNMAIGTISDKIENGICDTLLQFRDRMAGLKVYRHIYNDIHELDQQLQSRIIEGYSCFMDFCIQAARYYSIGGTKRWLKALWGTSKTLDDRAVAVAKAIFDIRYMGEELLHKSVSSIKQQNSELEAEVQGLREANDNDRLNTVQELLKVQGYSQESDFRFLKKYQDDLIANFDQVAWTGLEILKGRRLKNFTKNCPEMDRWLQSSHSCMLVLAGYNEVSVSSFGACWLSPIALDTIATLRSSAEPEKEPYAFYIPGLEKTDLLPQVLSHIAIQLLTANRRALRDDARYNELRGKIQLYSMAAENCDDGRISTNVNKTLQDVVLEVLNSFGEGQTVWIVVDRPDQCKQRGGPNHQKKVAKALVNLLESAKSTIRVLLVVNGHDWRVDDEFDEFGQSNQDSVMVHKAMQGPVDNWTAL